MTEAMEAEFDTMAAWTGDVALALGPEHHVPAGCRGSGSPAVLRWFLERLAVTRSDRMLDCGAGVGGPAAFAAEEVGVRPVLSEPEPGACRAAQRLFGLPTVQAGTALPFATGAFDVAWSLGVLCTVDEQDRLLAELRRVVTPEGRLGLLVFVARSAPLTDPPTGNRFPTPAGLDALLTGAGLTVEHSGTGDEFPATPGLWQDRVDAVAAELERRHGQDEAWRTADRQSAQIGRLLASGELVATMLVLRPV